MSYLHNNLMPFRIRQVQKANKTNRSNINYAQAKNIGLMFTMNRMDDYEAIRSFEKQLKSEGKQLTVLSFLPNNVENFDFHYDIFTRQDFSKFGRPRAENILNFIDQKFDFLYSLDCTPSLYLKYILAASKARYRIGCFQKEEDSKFFEMMIRLPEGAGVDELINQIYHYSNKL